MRTEITLTTIADFNSAIAYYLEKLPFLLSGPPNDSTLKEWVAKHEVNVHTPVFGMNWKNPDVHHITQVWSNTSGGWQGIGGSAMTRNYTTVIINNHYYLAAVFYGGRLAYLAEVDEKFRALGDLQKLPGIQDCEASLTVLYTTKR